MLNSVRQVSAGLLKDIGSCRTYTLKTISTAIEAYSPIDETIFVGFNAPETNPIWGQFRKYARQPSVYTGQKTVVEVYYANHLSEEWRRFVVCKELCHSLETDEGTHSVTAKSVERIVATFSMMSASKANGKMSLPFAAEMIAELGALELLCPMQEREQLLGEYGDAEKLCLGLKIPTAYKGAFDPEISKIIAGL